MNHRILVVEDNPANSELLCDWLEAQGYQPFAAENLEQAFAAFKRLLPDAVLLDVQLGPRTAFRWPDGFGSSRIFATCRFWLSPRTP